MISEFPDNGLRNPQAQIVAKVKALGFKKFNGKEHQLFWQSKWPTAKNRNMQATEYGEVIYTTGWIWYEQTWMPEVLKYCQSKGEDFK